MHRKVGTVHWGPRSVAIAPQARHGGKGEVHVGKGGKVVPPTANEWRARAEGGRGRN